MEPAAAAHGRAARTPAATAARNLRVAFWCSLAVAFAFTHWPRLAVGGDGVAVDKLVHAAGFGALAALCLLAHPRLPVVAGAAAMLLLAAADEASQAIPGLGRTADLEDWLADAVGILVAAAFAAAFRPVGRGASALLERRRRIASCAQLARPMTWFHLATAGALGFAAGAPLGVLLDSWFVRKGPQPWQYGLIGGLLGLAVGVHALWESGVRFRLRAMARERPCIACGSPLPGAERRCSACGAAVDARDWAPVALLPGSVELRACLVPVVQSLAAIIAISAGSIALVTVLRLRSDAVLRADTWYRMLPADARILGDIALVALVGAWGLWRCRVRIAGRVDRCGEACLACGFDLRATSPGSAAGTCHECGGGFVREGAPRPGH